MSNTKCRIKQEVLLSSFPHLNGHTLVFYTDLKIRADTSEGLDFGRERDS